MWKRIGREIMKLHIKRLFGYLLICALLFSMSGGQQISAATKYYKMLVHYVDLGAKHPRLLPLMLLNMVIITLFQRKSGYVPRKTK